MRFAVLTPTIRPQMLDITNRALAAQTFQDFRWLTIHGDPTEGFTLPRDFNDLLRQTEPDEAIVILEDCIDIPPDALENISRLDFDRTAYTFAVSKEGKWDWRKHKDGEIAPDHWEIDFAAAPRSLFFDVGGFDEDFCNGWSWENVEIAWRAQQAGYRFVCSPVTHGDAIDHDKILTHPFRNKLPNNDKRAHSTYVQAQTGNWKRAYL